MSFIPYGKQDITEDDIEKVVEVLRSDFITQGPEIDLFEKNLTAYTGAKYAVAFNSGTAALHAAYFACGVNKDDEVVTTPNTFVATSNAALYLNAKPVFADIEESTGNISVDEIRLKITDKTKVITPVDYGGQPCDMEAVYKLAKEHGCFVIEDASHAIGSRYKDGVTGGGAFADISIFSFHPVKHVTTGEGGAALTNDRELFEKLLLFRSHGVTKKDLINESPGPWYYEMHALGYNYRMTDMQAVLGSAQLAKLDKFVARRKEIADKYREAFKGNSFFDMVEIKEGRSSSYHLFPILLKERYRASKKNIVELFFENGIGVQTHYIPVNSQPYYQNLGYKTIDTPKAESFYKGEISIPMYPKMSEEDVEKVIGVVKEIFENIK